MVMAIGAILLSLAVWYDSIELSLVQVVILEIFFPVPFLLLMHVFIIPGFGLRVC